MELVASIVFNKRLLWLQSLINQYYFLLRLIKITKRKLPISLIAERTEIHSIVIYLVFSKPQTLSEYVHYSKSPPLLLSTLQKRIFINLLQQNCFHKLEETLYEVLERINPIQIIFVQKN